jgi:Nucleotidyl transferase AbiEii toxin, Type IV TA system
MPVRAIHRRVARIALKAAGRYGTALAGGNALLAHKVIDRYTADVDLFVPHEGPEFRTAADAVERALRAAGYQLTPVAFTGETEGLAGEIADGIAEWDVVAPDGEATQVQVAFFERMNAPVQIRGIGPVLSLDDVIATKVAALATRGEIRDYLDVAAILEHHAPAEVIRLARQLDPALGDHELAVAGDNLDRIDSRAFDRYGPEVAGWVRGRFTDWPRTSAAALKEPEAG